MARTVEPRDESDESKATITTMSAADRRKTKRETLANYLKTSEKPKMSTTTTHASTYGRSSMNMSRGGGTDIQRQSSKTSLNSQQSGHGTGKKRRTGSTLGTTSKTPTSALKNSGSGPTSAGK